MSHVLFHSKLYQLQIHASLELYSFFSMIVWEVKIWNYRKEWINEKDLGFCWFYFLVLVDLGKLPRFLCSCQELLHPDDSSSLLWDSIIAFYEVLFKKPQSLSTSCFFPSSRNQIWNLQTSLKTRSANTNLLTSIPWELMSIGKANTSFTPNAHDIVFISCLKCWVMLKM